MPVSRFRRDGFPPVSIIDFLENIASVVSPGWHRQSPELALVTKSFCISQVLLKPCFEWAAEVFQWNSYNLSWVSKSLAWNQCRIHTGVPGWKALKQLFNMARSPGGYAATYGDKAFCGGVYHEHRAVVQNRSRWTAGPT
jgi:hypothetical protein